MALRRGSFAVMALTAGLWATSAPAQLIDLGKYPDWSGQWNRAPDGGGPRYDPSKPLNAQGAPLKPDYQALHEASLRDQAAGGFGLDTHYSCMPMGVPRQMSGVSLMEFVFSPSVTYILFEDVTAHTRRIYTDATFPKIESRPLPAIPSANGSIPTAKGVMTRWKSKRATSGARTNGTSPACRWPTTTRPS